MGGKRSRTNYTRLTIEVLEDRVVPTINAIADSYSVLHDHVLTATVDGSGGVYGVLQNDTTTTANSIIVTEVNGVSTGKEKGRESFFVYNRW